MHCFGLWEYIQHENRWQLLSSGSTSSNGMEIPCQHSNISHHSGTSGQCSYLHQPFPVRPHWAWPCTSAFNQGCEECPHPKPKLLLPVSLPHTSRHLSSQCWSRPQQLWESAAPHPSGPWPTRRLGRWGSLLLPFVQGSQVCTAYRPMIKTLSSNTVLALWLFKAGV